MYDQHYHSYGILSISPSNKMAALGNLEGKVKVLQIGMLAAIYKFEIHLPL